MSVEAAAALAKTSLALPETGATVDLQALVDDGAFTARRVRILTIVVLAMLADGFDITVISIVSPALAKDLGLASPAMGLVFSAGIFGAIVGSVALGCVGDALGRRPAILISIAITSLAMLGTATSKDLGALLAWRFVTGIGTGAIAPLGLVLANEYAPRRVRATVTACMFLGLGAGGTAIAAWISTALMPRLGWRAIFAIGGGGNVAVALVLLAGLPESLKFLYARRPGSNALFRAVRRLEPNLPLGPATHFTWSGETVFARAPYRLLFAEGRTLTTPLLWAAMFSAQATPFALLLWLPTLLQSAGVSASVIGLTLTLHVALATVGGLVISWLVDRYGIAAVAALPLSGAPILLFTASLAPSSPLLVPLVAMSGFCVGGALQGLLVVSGLIYPTAIRASGVGIGMFVSRFGSVLGPAVLSVLIAGKAPMGVMFAACAAPLLVAGVLSLLLAPRRRGRGQRQRLIRPGIPPLSDAGQTRGSC